MQTRRVAAGLLAALLVIVFVLVVLNKASWIYFWIISAIALMYATFALPSEDSVE